MVDLSGPDETQTHHLRNVVTIFVAGLLIVALAVLGRYITMERGQFLIQTLGVMATLLLILVYIHQLGENKRLHEEERERNINRIILDDILRPSIDTAYKNKETLTTDFIHFGRQSFIQKPPGNDQSHPCLYLLTKREDIEPGGMSPLEGQHPRLYDELRTHDRLLRDLQLSIDGILQASVQNEAFQEELPDGFKKDNTHSQQALVSLHLNMTPAPNGFTNREQYRDFMEEVDALMEEYAPAEIEEFQNFWAQYENQLETSADALVQLRKGIRAEYGLQ